MTDDILAQAEENVKRRAARAAYLCSEKFDNSETQRAAFTLYKDFIMLGARMMQEELLNLNSDETQETTH